MSGARDNAGAPPGVTTSDPGPANDATFSNVPAAEPDFESQFGDLFRHDPFAKNQGEPKEPVAVTPVAPVSDPLTLQPVAPVAPVAAIPPIAPAPLTSPSAPAAPDANALMMRDTAAALAAATQNLQRPQGPQAPIEDASLNYMYDVPQQLAAELAHEEPARRVRALSYIQGAMAKEVHTRMRGEMQRYISTELPAFVNSMIQAQTFRDTVQRDFYQAYPQLRSPHLAPTVKHFTSEILQAEQQVNPSLTWNDALRDKIATAIFAAIPGLRGPAVPNQPNLNQPNQTPQPPRVFTNGARPAQPTARQDVATDIMDTLFG